MSPSGFLRWESVVFLLPVFALFLIALASVISLVRNHRRPLAVYLLLVVGVISYLIFIAQSSAETIDGGPAVFAVAFLMMGISFLGPILLSIGLIGIIKEAQTSIRVICVSSLGLVWLYVICLIALMLFR
ncbi:hypothetical protein RUESEDTHA_02337 [Ruegeria sp. THAF57]|nr:hypothetical protein RUESEDTHA_02337 [Ruegeria sp. THAF57]